MDPIEVHKQRLVGVGGGGEGRCEQLIFHIITIQPIQTIVHKTQKVYSIQTVTLNYFLAFTKGLALLYYLVIVLFLNIQFTDNNKVYVLYICS